MALSARQRRIVLGSALAITLGLAAWLSGDSEEEAPAPAAEQAPPTQAAGTAQSGRVGQLVESHPPAAGAAPAATTAGEIRDVFASQSWQAPPEEAAETAAAGEPEMPPLPFTYFGKLVVDGRVTVYLATEERNFAVRRGDVLNGDWRVEAIGPTAMVFRYLPLDKRTSLAIGRVR